MKMNCCDLATFSSTSKHPELKIKELILSIVLNWPSSQSNTEWLLLVLAGAVFRLRRLDFLF